MGAFKTVFNFYINSSIHVALAIVSMSFVTCFEFDVPVDINVFCFIGFASILGYNFVKFFGKAKFHYRSLSNRLRAIQVFSVVCFFIMCIFLLHLKTASLIAILIFGLVTFLYAIPLFPHQFFVDEKKELRRISGLKIYIIALVWSGVTVLLPLINNEFEVNDDVIFSMIQRFIFVIVLMLPFEIRDLNYDSLKLSTIPQRIGVKRTKVMGVLLLLLLLILEFFKDDVNLSYSWSLIIMVLILAFFLKYSTIEQGRYYSAFWVESVPIWWAILLLMFS